MNEIASLIEAVGPFPIPEKLPRDRADVVQAVRAVAQGATPAEIGGPRAIYQWLQSHAEHAATLPPWLEREYHRQLLDHLKTTYGRGTSAKGLVA